MTEPYYITEANCETKEIITREMTTEETEQYLAIIAASQAIQEERIAAAEKYARDKASALAKLTALGLTPEEAEAL